MDDDQLRRAVLLGICDAADAQLTGLIEAVRARARAGELTTVTELADQLLRDVPEGVDVEEVVLPGMAMTLASAILRLVFSEGD